MALIQCKNCGNNVSDKATICPHCGKQLIEEIIEKHLCEDCGAELPKDADVCPNCGCPITKDATTSQKVEITGVKIKNSQKAKKYIIIAISIIILIALIAVCSIAAKNKAIKEAEEQERIAYEQTLETYEQDLKKATNTMLKGAAEAENAGNLVKSVWYNAIYEKKDSSTDKYTTKNGKGYYFYDFNTALSNLFSSSSFSTKITSIKNNQDSVRTLMKRLTNPPEEYKEAYSALKEFYDAYLELTNLAIEPTGSYSTYSENFNDADTRTAKCYEAMGIYID